MSRTRTFKHMQKFAPFTPSQIPTCKAYSLHVQALDVKAQGHFRTIFKSLLNAASNGLWLIVIKEHLFKNSNATAVRVKGDPEEVAN